MISNREWEALSAYLDGELSTRERARLEVALESNAELRAAIEELRRTRMVLRSQPPIRAPRNFTLSPQMAGIRPKKGPTIELFPVLRLTSVLATLLFVFVVLGDLFLGGSQIGAPATLGETMEEPAPLVIQAMTEEPMVVEEAVENDVIVESEMAEKSLGVGDVAPLEAPAFEMPSEGEALAPDKEALPSHAGTPSPPPTITLPTSTPTESPTITSEIIRSMDEEASTMREPPSQGAGFIRSRLTLRILEVTLALMGVITAALAFYLRPSRRP
jgi:anti-sigma factor RsiW